jgi:hypothetical protein
VGFIRLLGQSSFNFRKSSLDNRKSLGPAHYIPETRSERDPREFTPEESRRARAIPTLCSAPHTWTLGPPRDDRTPLRARAPHGRQAAHPRVRILNNIVLNQSAS